MTLPSPADYVDLLQHPAACFIDPELQRATARTDSLGLPLAYRGNYAVAFNMQTATKAYAVRCFTRDVPDVQRRYDAISRFCDAYVDPALCTFEYQARGVRHQNEMFPIIKMEWAAGERLDTWLLNNHEDRRELRRVGEGIAQIADRLERKGAAHGDLQHGNLVVESGWVRLIDYDGMFVPGLETLQSPVLGHRNFQHPARTDSQFDSRMDRFSLLVIFIGLNAIAADPTRIARYGCDERVLFERADFENPDGSPLFHELVHDVTVGKWTLALIDACRKSPRQCPSLESVLTGSYLEQVGVVTLSATGPRTTSVTPESAAAGAAALGGSAMRRPRPRGQTRAAAAPVPPTPAPSWVQPPGGQQVMPAGVSAMPASSIPYTASPVTPSHGRSRGLFVAGSVGVLILAFWHPWVRPQVIPHFPDYTAPPRLYKTEAPRTLSVRRDRISAVKTRTPEARTTAPADPPSEIPGVAEATQSPTPEKSRSSPVPQGLRHVAAAEHAEPDIVINVPPRPVPPRPTSAAADIEALAQRGRLPSSSAETGKAEGRVPQATCALPDQDAASTSLVSPNVPDSLEGRNAIAEVRVKIDAAGRVLSVSIAHTTNNAQADAAALQAARASSFRPARKNCETISGEYSVEFTFN